LSYERNSLPTKYISLTVELKNRDKYWQRYFSNPVYLRLVEKKFGLLKRKKIEGMALIRLKHKIKEN